MNPFRYRGYYYDSETGLYYLRSRYYNPEWGRFLNADAYVDTEEYGFGGNMFSYCGNNPVNKIDVTGYITFSLDKNKVAFIFSKSDDYTRNTAEKYTFTDACHLYACEKAANASASILPNASKFYNYFLSCKGGTLKYNYYEAYEDDKTIQEAVDSNVNKLKNWVKNNRPYSNRYYYVYSNLSDTIGVDNLDYDWYAAINRHNISLYAEVYYNSNKKTYTMTYTVTAYDRYNFDIYCRKIKTPVEWSGRFVVLGWAVFFNTIGSYSKTISWTV